MPASGFQSVQFREIEFACGLRDARIMKHFERRPTEEAQLRARLAGDDLPTTFWRMLARLGFAMPAEASLAWLDRDPAARQQVLAALIDLDSNPVREPAG